MTTDLFVCVANDDIYNLNKLILSGADVNMINENKETPLHVAAMSGSFKCGKTLIASGANVNAKTNLFEETPLHFAVQQGCEELLILLLDAGAEVDAKNCDMEGPVFTAIRWCRPNMIPLLAQRGANLNDINLLGQTPLAVAMNFESKCVIKALLDAGAVEEISGISKSKLDLLQLEFPKTDTVETMNRPMPVNSNKEHKKCFREADPDVSELFECVSKNQVDILEEKLKESPEKSNGTAKFNLEGLLHAAATYGATECVSALIRYGANVNSLTECDIESPLHIAIREGYFDMFFELLRNGADIEATNCDGETPIFTAVKNNRIEFFRVLTRMGASTNHINFGGISPIHFAVMASNRFMVQSLLYYGADPALGNLNPYMYAFKSSEFEIASIVQKKAPELSKETHLPNNVFSIIQRDDVAELNILLNMGFEIDQVDPLEGSPLHSAVRNGSVGCINFLLSRGANINVVDTQRNETPFMTSIGRNEEITQLLLQVEGIDVVTIKNKDGESSLFYAVRHNLPELVKEIINRGADVNEQNYHGRTPLYVAVALRNKCIAKQLLNSGADPLSEVHTSYGLADDMGEKEILGILKAKGAKKDASRQARTVSRQSRLNNTSSISMLTGSTEQRIAPVQSLTEQPVEDTDDVPPREYTPNGIRHGMCVICGRNKATQIFIPCGHIGCCWGCIKKFVEDHNPCPICGLKFYATKTHSLLSTQQ